MMKEKQQKKHSCRQWKKLGAKLGKGAITSYFNQVDPALPLSEQVEYEVKQE